MYIYIHIYNLRGKKNSSEGGVGGGGTREGGEKGKKEQKMRLRVHVYPPGFFVFLF